MRILLATGIYPPDLGGPATYVEKLAEELTGAGHQVTVATYGSVNGIEMHERRWTIVRVRKSGGPLFRWKRFAKALKEHGKSAEVIVAFSSVSCGVPLMMSGLKRPLKILRLGGDFFWERYTAIGGRLGLGEWYDGRQKGGARERVIRRMTRQLNRAIMPRLLRSFDHVVYSTAYQQAIHESQYKNLPSRSVIENALPVSEPVRHTLHHPVRLLYLGRFVGFKNLAGLAKAMTLLPEATLTLAGDGPMKKTIAHEVRTLGLGDRVRVHAPVSGIVKRALFNEHDLMVMPSLTEISPHSALEARSAGLPVLITKETGLSDELMSGMLKADMRTPEEIAAAVATAKQRYAGLADVASSRMQERKWGVVAGEWMRLIQLLHG